MKPRVLKPGDVVQIRPEATENGFQGCFLLVTKLLPSGAEGYINAPWYVTAPAEIGAPYMRIVLRLRWEEMEYIGRAAWIPPDGPGEDG